MPQGDTPPVISGSAERLQGQDEKGSVTVGGGGSIIAVMATDLDARSLLESLVGRQISTVTGRPNTVLGLSGDRRDCWN